MERVEQVGKLGADNLEGAQVVDAVLVNVNAHLDLVFAINCLIT